MREFRTVVPLANSSWEIGYTDSIVMMGSCFSENIGAVLIDSKFQIDLNPFGILFNPASIAQGIETLIHCRFYEPKDLFEQNGLWNSFDHHGCFSSVDREAMLQGLNNRIKSSAESIRKATYLIITFGTAWVYKYRATGRIVANCHKVPAKEFDRYRLTVSSIVDQWTLINELMKLNSKLRILFTVSPVRHWKDGAFDNQLSKSTLLLAVDQLISFFGQDRAAYFPSYEILMDELRDYRFYADDMLHPSSLAVDYISERFCEQFMNAGTRDLMQKIHRIKQSCNHRPLNKGTKAYQEHLKRTLNEIHDFECRFPFINFKEERQMLQQNLSNENKID